MWMPEAWRKDRGQARVMVFAQPHREDVELPVAGEQCVERGKITKRLLHNLRARFNEDAMHSGRDGMKLACAACSHEQPQGVFALGFLIERTDDLAQII